MCCKQLVAPLRPHKGSSEACALTVTFMPKSPVFDPLDLRPVREFVADGSLPFHIKTAEKFCRDKIIGSIKVGNRWCTTPADIRAFYWKKANAEFKKNHC